VNDLVAAPNPTESVDDCEQNSQNKGDRAANNQQELRLLRLV